MKPLDHTDSRQRSNRKTLGSRGSGDVLIQSCNSNSDIINEVAGKNSNRGSKKGYKFNGVEELSIKSQSRNKLTFASHQ